MIDDVETPISETEVLSDQLSQAWEEVLGDGSAGDSSASFFELGGDSLRIVQLWTAIERFWGGTIDVDAFLEAPTLQTMSRILSPARQQTPVTADATSLDRELYLRLLSFTNGWPGDRPTDDRLVAAFNVKGARTPVVMIAQFGDEVANFARAVGPETPMYGLRSGHLVIDYVPDQIDCVVAQYLDAIEAVRPEGPLVVMGVCQGCLLAEPIVATLRARGREVPLYVVVEWHFGTVAYDGPTLVVFGSESEHDATDAQVEAMFGRLIEPGHLDVSRLSGGHGEAIVGESGERLADQISAHLNSYVSTHPVER